jgi:hypothetical protein
MVLLSMKSQKFFLEELKQKCQRRDVAMVLGADFNLIRSRGDKDNSNIDRRLVDLFNDFIAEHQLLELK